MLSPAARRVVQEMYDTFSDRTRWTRNSMARTSDGSCTHSRDPDATSWCAIGVLLRETGDEDVQDEVWHAIGDPRKLNDIGGYELLMERLTVLLARGEPCE